MPFRIAWISADKRFECPPVRATNGEAVEIGSFFFSCEKVFE